MTNADVTRHNVKSALRDALVTELEPLDVPVLWGVPISAPAGRKVVMLGSIETDLNEVPTMKSGRKARNDDFTIPVLCWRYNAGDKTPEDIERDVEELARRIDDALADDPTLDGTPTLSSAVVVRFDGPSSAPADNGKGWRAWVEMSIRCKTRLA